MIPGDTRKIHLSRQQYINSLRVLEDTETIISDKSQNKIHKNGTTVVPYKSVDDLELDLANVPSLPELVLVSQNCRFFESFDIGLIKGDNGAILRRGRWAILETILDTPPRSSNGG